MAYGKKLNVKYVHKNEVKCRKHHFYIRNLILMKRVYFLNEIELDLKIYKLQKTLGKIGPNSTYC